MDSDSLQLILGGTAHEKQLPDGKRPHLLRDLIGKEGVAHVGLPEIGGHLGQKFVGGNPDIHGKTQLPADAFTDLIGRSPWIPEEMDGGAHVQKRFVDAEFFNIRGVVG